MSEKVQTKRRRQKGTGAIFFRKRDKRWVARADIVTLDGGRKSKEFVAKDRSTALARLQEARDSGLLRRGRFDARPVKDFAEAWIKSFDSMQRPYKASTRAGHEVDVERYIIPRLGTLRLGDLDVVRVARWLREMKDDAVGAAAISRACRCLSTMLSTAVTNGAIASNPVKSLARSQRPAYQAPDAKTLSLAQVWKLFDELGHYRYGAMAIVAATTAMRQSELIGLRWTNVDLKKGTIAVRETLVQVNGKFHAGPPKTERSKRTIALPAEALAALRAHQAGMHAERGKPDEGDLVFVTEGGNPVQRGYLLRTVLAPALKRAGLPRITWRELRHSCATILIELGEPLEVVSRTLGHSDPGVTSKVYNKAFRGQERRAADAIDAGLRKLRLSVKKGVKHSKRASGGSRKTKKKPR